MSRGMTNAQRFEAIETALGNFEGVRDAIQTMQDEEIPELFRRAQEWESLDRRVKTLEAGKGVEASGSGSSPQVEERLGMIEDTQRQLGEAVKDLTVEVKDVVAALHAEMSELTATVKVMMIALGNSSHEGGPSERRGKAKVPDPRPYAGERDAQKLENFIFDMDQYFLASGIDSEESQLNRATMFLTDAAKVWWRTKYHEIQAGRCRISTWDELKQELKGHFYPENVDYLARRKLRDLTQKGSVQDYVKQFTTIMLDIRDMTEKDKLFYFMDGLSREAAIELQRRRVQTLSDAVTAAERLSDYDIGFPTSMKSQSASHSSGGSSGQSARSSKSKSGGGSNGSAPQTPSSSSSRGSNTGGKPKALSCFLCRGPHRVAECPQRAALNAMQAKLQEEVRKCEREVEEESENEDQARPRIGSLRFLED